MDGRGVSMKTHATLLGWLQRQSCLEVWTIAKNFSVEKLCENKEALLVNMLLK
jgi:hypothetical protein